MPYKDTLANIKATVIEREPMYFRLIGQTTKFRLIAFYDAAGFIPSVIGRTINGHFQTHARLEDVTWIQTKDK